MKLDMNQPLKALDGLPIYETVQHIDKNEPFTLKACAIKALVAHYQTDDTLTGEDKMVRWQLAKKIHSGAEKYSAEDIAAIKTYIGKAFGVLVVGSAFDALDSK